MSTFKCAFELSVDSSFDVQKALVQVTYADMKVASLVLSRTEDEPKKKEKMTMDLSSNECRALAEMLIASANLMETK